MNDLVPFTVLVRPEVLERVKAWIDRIPHDPSAVYELELHYDGFDRNNLFGGALLGIGLETAEAASDA